MDTSDKSCRVMVEKNLHQRGLFAATVVRGIMTDTITNIDLHKKCADVLFQHAQGRSDILWGNVK
jgi:hypothetical protein